MMTCIDQKIANTPSLLGGIENFFINTPLNKMGVTQSEYSPYSKKFHKTLKKNPTILNMIGLSFILDARLLITGIINNESYMSYQLDIRFKINLRAVYPL